MSLRLPEGIRFDRQELAGSFGDIGVMAPLAVALITMNRLNATIVLGAAGFLYIAGGLYYRIPMPVQPLKATAAIALATGAAPAALSATALIMGAILLTLAVTGGATYLARVFSRPVIRGIQLSLGMTLMTAGWERISDARLLSGAGERLLSAGGLAVPAGVLLGVACLAVFLLSRRFDRLPSSIAVLVFGIIAGLALGGASGLGSLSWGPDLAFTGFPAGADFRFALFTLVLPQIPLTFGNSVVATSDVAGRYFGRNADRVTTRALCGSLGIANLLGGFAGAMPMCHGSGGLTAHRCFGARTGGAVIIIGAALLLLGLAMGSSAVALFSLIPLSVLGFLLFYIGIEHAMLVKDLRDDLPELAIAAAVALASVIFGSLIWGLALGLSLTGSRRLVRLSRRPSRGAQSQER